MKNLFALFLLAFVMSACTGKAKEPTQKSIVLEGTILNSVSKTVTLKIYKNIIEQPFSITVPLDQNNHFVFNYPTDTPVRIDFTHAEASPSQQWYEAPKFYAWLFEPNDAINFTFDAQNFWQSIKATGTNAAKINYYIADFVKADLEQKWRDQVETNYELPLDKQFAFLDKMLTDKQQTFKQFEKDCTPLFREFQASEIKSMIFLNKITTANKLRTEPTFKLHSEPALQQFLKQKIHTCQPLLVSSDYLQYCNLMVELKFSNYLEETAQKPTLPLYEAFLKNNEPAMNEILSLSNLQVLFESKDFQVATTLKEFRTKYPQNPLGKIIEQALVSGKAVDFSLKNEKGIAKNLSDFKGKVIVLDFWASWCKPCIGDMPFSHQVKTHFKNNPDIVFLNISIDEDESSWKEAVAKYKIEGQNLLANPQTKSDYKIVSVPTYYVVGKDGMLEIAPRPYSQENTAQLIDFLEKTLKE